MRALPARRPAFYSRIAESRSRRSRRVSLYLPNLSLLFSFQSLKPLASRRSRRELLPLRRPKRPPFGGPVNAPSSAGRPTSGASLRLSSGSHSSAGEVYHPGPGCQRLLAVPPPARSLPHTLLFIADRGTSSPSPLGGASRSEFCRNLSVRTLPQKSATGIVASRKERSSRFSELFCDNRLQEVITIR